MRKLPLGMLALVTACVGLNLVFVGCGSEDAGPIGPASDSGTDGTDGTDGTVTPPPTDSSVPDSGRTDSSTEGGVPGCTASPNGATCTQDTDCCSKICTLAGDGGTAKVCAASIPGGCKANDQACADGNECCGLSCKDARCQTCVPDSPIAGNCTVNEDCCSLNCGADKKCAGIVAPPPPDGGVVDGGVQPPPVCRVQGNGCTAPTDCCSGVCSNGVCTSGSFCSQEGERCQNDFECCGGLCGKAAGQTVGQCQTIPSGGGCKPTGTVCEGAGCDNTCCSKSCGPYGVTNTKVCQPPSGCRPDYELCEKDDDCCGNDPNPNGGLPSSKQPYCEKAAGARFGRCTKAGQCSPPGAVCKSADGACGVNNRCCDPILANGSPAPSNYCQNNPENCCKKDTLGIPRCVTQVRDCTVAPTGQVCATSADCCGLPCVDNKCGAACVPRDGTCTSAADCCNGLNCNLPQGSAEGTCGDPPAPPPPPPTDAGVDSGVDSGTPPPPACSLYGQTCGAGTTCCNAVPCTNGRCVFP